MKSTTMGMDIICLMLLGNVFNPELTGGGYAGCVFLPDGLAPCLNTMQGGNRQPFILLCDDTNESENR